MRAKVAEYAEKIVKLEERHEAIMEMWQLQMRNLPLKEYLICIGRKGDKVIAENMKAYWIESADGAER